MPRLFTGIEIPSDLAARLAVLRGGLPGARWIEPEDYHLTLSFIGDIDEGLAGEAHDELSRVQSAPPSIRLTSLSAFGGDKPRAIVAEAECGPELAALQASQERALRRIGTPVDRRKFAPHVTIARLRSVPAFSVAQYLESRALAPAAFVAQRFVLYSSRPSRGGGPYVVEAAYPLG
jgi:2'-5' RNA ligase